MRQRLESLIDKYEKKLRMDELNSNNRYYLGKIEAFKTALAIFETYGMEEN